MHGIGDPRSGESGLPGSCQAPGRGRGGGRVAHVARGRGRGLLHPHPGHVRIPAVPYPSRTGARPSACVWGRDKLENSRRLRTRHSVVGASAEKERGPGGGVARTGEGGGASETGVGLVGVSPSGRNSQRVGRWQSGKGTGGGSAYQVAGRVSLRLAFSRVESARSRVLGVAGCFASAQGCGSGEGPAAGRVSSAHPRWRATLRTVEGAAGGGVTAVGGRGH